MYLRCLLRGYRRIKLKVRHEGFNNSHKSETIFTGTRRIFYWKTRDTKSGSCHCNISDSSCSTQAAPHIYITYMSQDMPHSGRQMKQKNLREKNKSIFLPMKWRASVTWPQTWHKDGRQSRRRMWAINNKSRKCTLHMQHSWWFTEPSGWNFIPLGLGSIWHHFFLPQTNTSGAECRLSI